MGGGVSIDGSVRPETICVQAIGGNRAKLWLPSRDVRDLSHKQLQHMC